MLDRGIYLSPSQFELNFISAAHSQEDVDALLAAMESSVLEINSEINSEKKS